MNKKEGLHDHKLKPLIKENCHVGLPSICFSYLDEYLGHDQS